MTSVVTQLGVLGVFLLMVPESACIPVPSEATLLFAGVAVHQGWMSLPLAVAGATAGNLVGSLLAYALGARHALERVPLARGAIERWGALLDRYGTGAVLLARLLPLARTFVALPAGARRLPLAPFAALTAIGSALWALGFVALGMAAASAWRTLDGLAGRALLVVGLLALAASLHRRGGEQGPRVRVRTPAPHAARRRPRTSSRRA
ncbi:MAG TPA: DedA family protein [Solirubrobacteraceae bacterium]|nr:DedA family protein [Solirubrobacteraceae bacterium]